MLNNDRFYYFANISIGNPPQVQSLVINTQGGDTWVNEASSAYCKDSPSSCELEGVYHANRSGTVVSTDFSYYDQKGDYVTDTVQMGGFHLDAVRFGVAYQSAGLGELGLGNVSLEKQGDGYLNLPSALYHSGLIQCYAYSIWMDSLNASTGQLVLGGLDTTKYSGALSTLEMESGAIKNGQVAIRVQQHQCSATRYSTVSQPRQQQRLHQTA